MLKVITQPEELISVNDVEEFVRAEFATSEEPLIESLITAARQWCEQYLRRAIGIQTLEQRLAGFPSGAIILRAPIQSVTSIKYLDQNKDEVTLSASNYVVSDSEPAKVIPSSVWPLAYASDDSVRVRYQSGYNVSGSPITTTALPKTIRTAMLMMIADMYSNRESQVEKVLTANPTVERLLSTYRLEMGL